jgi:hypothetical protein
MVGEIVAGFRCYGFLQPRPCRSTRAEKNAGIPSLCLACSVPYVHHSAASPACPEDIGPAFEGLKGRTDALYVSGDPLMVTNRIRINTLAQGARLPTIYVAREFVETGG